MVPVDYLQWTETAAFQRLVPAVQEQITWALRYLPGLEARGIPPEMQALVRTLTHNARTGVRWQNILFQYDWDMLLDGHPHAVDLIESLWFGSISTLRAKVYREAGARKLRAKTWTKKDEPLRLWIQALVSPVPDPAPAPEPGVDLASVFGPCSCGAGFEADAPPHAPSCSIWGG